MANSDSRKTLSSTTTKMQAGGGIGHIVNEIVLRYPEPLGIHVQVTLEAATQYLLKAHQLAAGVPFQWAYIDRPQEGSLFIVFLVPQQRVFPNDGIRYQEQESRFTIPTGGGRELEVTEAKFGFIPDSTDTAAFRVRRRFRFIKGGNQQLMLVHYFAGQSMPIIPALRNQPVRQYPLRPLNEPAMYVLGEKMGQKVILPQRNMHPGHPSQAMGVGTGMPGMVGMGGGMQHQAAMLAAQNRDMEALERRQARERATGMPAHSQVGLHDDDSGDEYDHISTRSLALARYKRNHEYMNEVFMHAAFGDKKPKELVDPYACFNEEEIKEKISKLEKEVEELNAKAEERREAARQRERTESADSVGDVSMTSSGTVPLETTAA